MTQSELLDTIVALAKRRGYTVFEDEDGLNIDVRSERFVNLTEFAKDLHKALEKARA